MKRPERVRVLRARRLRALGEAVLTAAGTPAAEARLVAGELTENSLLGLDSHGLIRLAQYVRQVGEGTLRPGAPQRVVRETPTTLVVDGGLNFGMVTARFMADRVAGLARERGLAAAVSRHAHHVGRLGSSVERLARAGFFALATANASRQGHYVAPWGGTRPRLSTNPLAYACPGGRGPLVLDMSTSALAEGTIRMAGQRGEKLPPGCVLDPEGRPTTDPDDFYRGHWGTILPFGGRQGYKGYGLSLLVEILGTALAGVAEPPGGRQASYINGFFILAIDPDAFSGRRRFNRLVDLLVDEIHAVPPAAGVDRVLLPGEREQRVRAARIARGVPVAEATWRELSAAAAGVGLLLGEDGICRPA